MRLILTVLRRRWIIARVSRAPNSFGRRRLREAPDHSPPGFAAAHPETVPAESAAQGELYGSIATSGSLSRSQVDLFQRREPLHVTSRRRALPAPYDDPSVVLPGPRAIMRPALSATLAVSTEDNE